MALPRKEKEPYFGAVVMLDALGTRVHSVDAARRFLAARSSFIDGLGDRLVELSQWAKRVDKSLGAPDVVTFGDTVLPAWNLPKSAPERFLPLLAEWLRPSIMVGLRARFLCRGALPIGHYFRDEATVIGPAVTDAASWYESADWIGIIATPACSHRLAFVAERIGDLEQLSRWFVEYDVPLSTGAQRRLWTVAWPARYPQSGSSRTSEPVSGRELLLYQLADYAVPVGTENKHANALRFFDWYHSNVRIGVQDTTRQVNKRMQPTKARRRG